MKCVRCDRPFTGYELDHALYRPVFDSFFCYKCIVEVLKEFIIKKLEIDELKKS